MPFLIIIEDKYQLETKIKKTCIFKSLPDAYNYAITYSNKFSHNIYPLDESQKNKIIWKTKIGNYFPISTCKIIELENDSIWNIYNSLDLKREQKPYPQILNLLRLHDIF